MNKSIRAMNWKTGNDELSQTVEPSLQWQMIVDRNGATGDERADLEEQIELLKNITPEAQDIYFEQVADPRTDYEIALDQWQDETEATHKSAIRDGVSSAEWYDGQEEVEF